MPFQDSHIAILWDDCETNSDPTRYDLFLLR